eukprot:TRINITY_DN2445_c0_g1_i1.p1 TRINITY_DN2445_c0_g1~~TRINITY_DN2445_c0_g1_i1.p1  ORF type:complete len:139 (-),score=1.90 TRINITY_DN2445_c0_g1_i1:254-670(-)
MRVLFIRELIAAVRGRVARHDQLFPSPSTCQLSACIRSGVIPLLFLRLYRLPACLFFSSVACSCVLCRPDILLVVRSRLSSCCAVPSSCSFPFAVAIFLLRVSFSIYRVTRCCESCCSPAARESKCGGAYIQELFAAA